MKTLKCAVLVLAITAVTLVATGCASGGSTTAAVQQPTRVVAQQPAAASANDSQFVARLVAGSPWRVEWQAYTTKGTFELLFRMEDGNLKASLRNVPGLCSICRDGEFEIKAVSNGHIRLGTASGTRYDFKFDQEDGRLVGEGTTRSGYYIFASGSPKK